MKYWIAMFGVVCVLVTMPGCRRSEPQQDDRFDPEVDALASTVRVAIDWNLGNDQRIISREALKRRSGEPAPAPASPPSRPPEAAIEKPVRNAPAANTARRPPPRTETESVSE